MNTNEKHRAKDCRFLNQHFVKQQRSACLRRAWLSGVAIAIVGTALLLISCNGRKNADSTQTASKSQRAIQPSPREQLNLLVDNEVISTTPIVVALPPRIDNSTIQPHNRASSEAQLSFAAVLELVRSRTDEIQLPLSTDFGRTVELDIGDRIKAQHFYIAGREAELQKRFFQSNQAFKRAHELDPTSETIVRCLARSASNIGNNEQAAEQYQNLLTQVPGDSEAIYFLGMSAAQRGNFEEAIIHLGSLRQRFTHSPVANILADHTLVAALHALHFDQAGIEIAMAVIGQETPQPRTIEERRAIEAIDRQHASLWQLIGDAHLRLQNDTKAMHAYSQSRQLGSSDAIAITTRMIYASLRAGRTFEAQRFFLNLMDEHSATSDDRLVDLARYVHQHSSSTQTLAECIAEIDAKRGSDPTTARVGSQASFDSQKTRVLAALMSPDEGARLLIEFLSESPRDLAAFRSLINRLTTTTDETAATALPIATGMMADHPQFAIEYADTFFESVGFDAALESALLADRSASPSRDLLHGRMHFLVNNYGRAWQVTMNALNASPESAALVVNAFEIAAALNEPDLLNNPLLRTDLTHTSHLLRQSRALAKLGESANAIALARQAVDHDEQNPQAWQHLAEARLVPPVSARGAVIALEKAPELDPTFEPAYATLLQIYNQGGPLEDQAEFEATWNRLSQTLPRSELRQLLIIDQLLAQHRYPQATERLTSLFTETPWQSNIVDRLVKSWLGSREFQAARQWLDTQRQQRPNDPNLLRAQVVILHHEGLAEDAELLLTKRLAKSSTDPLANNLLEWLYLAENRTDDAFALTESRLLQQPTAIGRSIRLLELYASNDRTTEAIRELVPLYERFNALSQPNAKRLVNVVSRLSHDDTAENDAARRARMTVFRQYVERWPDAPVQTYVDALIAIAQVNESPQDFASLLEKMLADAPGAQGSQTTAILPYRNLAEAVVQSGWPELAGDFLVERLADERITDKDSRQLLVQVAQACYAASGSVGKARTVIATAAEQGDLRHLPSAGGTTDAITEAEYSLSILCTLIGQDDAADELLIGVLQKSLNYTMALNNLGFRRIDQGRNDEDSIAHITRALELQPDDPNILDTAAWLRYKQGRFENSAADDNDIQNLGAKELITKSLAILADRNETPSAEMLDHQGDILWRIGNTSAAIEAWNASVATIEDETYRNETLESYLRFQRGGWGILIHPAETLFDHLHAAQLQRTKDKLAAVERGAEPSIAKTFDELS